MFEKLKRILWSSPTSVSVFPRSPQEELLHSISPEEFENNEIVATCIDKILKTVRYVPLQLFYKNELHPDSDKVLHPFKFNEISLSTFIYKSLNSFIIKGYARFKIKRSDKKGLFNSVVFINNDNDNYFFRESDTKPGEFYYSTPDEREIYPSYLTYMNSVKKTSGFFIADFKTPSYKSEFENTTIVSRLAPYVKTINALNSRGFGLAKGDYNSSHIIILPKDVTKEQQETIIEAFKNRKPGDPLVFTGVDVRVETLNDEIKDIFSKISYDDLKRSIIQAFGIPVALLSPANSDGAKYTSNYKESRYSFLEDTIIGGYLEPFAEFLTSVLCPPDYYIAFDYNVLEGLKEKRIDYAQQISNVNFLNDEEKKELVGI